MMQLHDSAWLDRGWGKRDIFFLQQAVPRHTVDGGVALVREPEMDQPFVRQTFGTSGTLCPLQQLSSPRSTLVQCDKTLFSLGIVLIELWFERHIEDLRSRYDLVNRGGNKVVMEANKIAARFYQLKSGHAVIAKYLRQIRKRRDMKCWWCGHKYQTRDNLFKWCKRWKREQKRLWIDGQEGGKGYEGVEKVLKKPKISLPMSLVFAEEKCSQALMDFLSCIDVGRISGVVEEVENSDHKESSDGGV